MRLEWGTGGGGQHRGARRVPAVLSSILQTAVPADSPPPTWPRAPCWRSPWAAGCPWPALAHTSGTLLSDTVSGPPTAPVSLDFPALPTMHKGEFSSYTPIPIALLLVLSLLGPPINFTGPRPQARGLCVATNLLSFRPHRQEPFPGVKKRTAAGWVSGSANLRKWKCHYSRSSDRNCEFF